MPPDGRFDRLAERAVVGDDDRLGARIVLGLGEQVGGQPIRIIVLVGDDEHFRGAGNHVDPDGAENLALGGGDIGIARTDDLGDRGDRLRAIGERGNA